jgi:hypothetical protein
MENVNHSIEWAEKICEILNITKMIDEVVKDRCINLFEIDDLFIPRSLRNGDRVESII